MTLKMGIKGLLPVVSSCLIKKHISCFEKHRIGIDGHAWLHSILPTVALQVFNNEKNNLHMEIFLKRIDKLRKFGIVPVVVFDGDSLPSKWAVNEKRRIKREENRLLAVSEIKKGNLKHAMKYIIGSLHVKKEMINEMCLFLRKNGIEVIVSPYESDAQLSYLQKIGYVHSIITEDSDLMVYDCDRVLYKYGKDHVLCYEKRALKHADSFLYDNLLEISILSGCDYLENIKGIGINSAIKLFKKYRNVEDIIGSIRAKRHVSDEYLWDFTKAKLTFKFQVVFDPLRNRRVYLDGSERTKCHTFLGDVSAGHNIELKKMFSDSVPQTDTNKSKIKSDILKKMPFHDAIENKKNILLHGTLPKINLREKNGLLDIQHNVNHFIPNQFKNSPTQMLQRMITKKKFE